MRCIEISMDFLLHLRSQGLIETWDVLKYFSDEEKEILQKAINRNMRCIEMASLALFDEVTLD